MKRKNVLLALSNLLLILVFSLSIFNPIPVYADSYISVTLGADLSDEQKQQMLDYFKVTQNDANILEVTSQEEYDALGKVATSAQLGTKSISCSYVEPTNSGGLDITTNNLTWVTEGMIKNALITAGITDAKVIAAAPFKVSGTAALTGILKGFESNSNGEKLDENNKEAANEELFVTGELGDEIGQDDATNLINEIKTKVVKESPKTEDEVNNIVDDVISKYNYKLSEDTINKIKSLMNKINDLNLDYSSIKSQLKDISNNLKDKISSDEAKGFFSKIGSFFSQIGKFFSKLWNAIFN